jgi:rhodanese-related sulfurtransferase
VARTDVDNTAWADLAARLGQRSVLVVVDERGDEQRNVAAAMECVVDVTRLGCDVVDQADAAFQVAFIGPVFAERPAEIRRAALHQAVQHLLPGGLLVLDPEAADAFVPMCAEVGLIPLSDVIACPPFTLFQRCERTTVHDLLWEARALIARVRPLALSAELAGSRPPIVVDIRTHTDRCRFGVIAGAIHVPRTVLEWHLDASNGYRHPGVVSYADPLVVVCNAGYSSSLAAANPVRIGFTDVRDLIGGMRGWLRDDLPVEAPDHAHLDL